LPPGSLASAWTCRTFCNRPADDPRARLPSLVNCGGRVPIVDRPWTSRPPTLWCSARDLRFGRGDDGRRFRRGSLTANSRCSVEFTGAGYLIEPSCAP
jgi:hypothetical protein